MSDANRIHPSAVTMLRWILRGSLVAAFFGAAPAAAVTPSVLPDGLASARFLTVPASGTLPESSLPETVSSRLEIAAAWSFVQGGTAAGVSARPRLRAASRVAAEAAFARLGFPQLWNARGPPASPLPHST